MNSIDRKFREQTEFYKSNFEKYGYSELSILMPSDRRTIRYYELIKNFEFYQQLLRGKQEKFTICDAGCGFGDASAYLTALNLKNYQYLGLDVVDEFLNIGKEKYGSDKVRFMKRNFITDDISDLEFDYAISSQTFTVCYTEEDNNYDVIFRSIEKLFRQCKKGVSFNFFTDRGEFQREGTAYHDPVELIRFAYTLSTNVVLDNGCFPYECTLTIMKDNSLKENGMVFDRFVRIHQNEFDKGLFVVKENQKNSAAGKESVVVKL